MGAATRGRGAFRRRGGSRVRAGGRDPRPHLRPMRVLATADAVGGVWTYVLELADALEPLGIELHAATMGAPPDERQRAEAARSALSDLHVSSFALEWEDDPWRDVDAAGDWL